MTETREDKIMFRKPKLAQGEDAPDRLAAKPTARERVAYKGAKIIAGDRDETYGPPVVNMQHIAELWTSYLDIRGLLRGGKLSGEDVAHMNTLQKMARTAGNKKAVEDNYVDGVGYQAIAAECAIAEKGEPTK